MSSCDVMHTSLLLPFVDCAKRDVNVNLHGLWARYSMMMIRIAGQLLVCARIRFQ
jgi:hypothetical protein